jgi:hypothetical protein
MNDEQNIANRVATTLTGKFFVGQRVRIGGAWTRDHAKGKEATIVAYVGKAVGMPGDVWQLDPPYPENDDAEGWHSDFLEPV